MLFSPRLNYALARAATLHRSQVRLDTSRTPYISHLVAVAMILSSVTDDEDIIIAGLMHDSLEDVPGYTYEDLIHEYGERVASIVFHVTEPLDANKPESEQLPWLVRKQAYLKQLRKGGVESALVSCADKIHNIESLLANYEKEGEEFLKRFTSSFRNRAWFHEEVLAVIIEKLGDDHGLVVRFRDAHERSLRVVEEIENPTL